MRDILRIELLLELPKKDNIKRLIGFLGLLIFSYSSLEGILRLNRTALISFCISIFFITIYNSSLFILSKLNSKYYRLWMALPVSKKKYFVVINIVSYLKNFILKITPFILAFIIVGLLNKDISILFGITYFVLLNLIAIFASIIGLSVAILYNSLKSPKIGIKKSIFHFNCFIYCWFKRECICFFKNKLFFINHFAYAIFITVFLFNIAKFKFNVEYTALLSVIFIHL